MAIIMHLNTPVLIIPFKLVLTTCSQFLMTPLRNFSCPHMNFTCPDIAATSELLYPEQFSSGDRSTVVHLDKILYSFQKEHCLAMITLFQHTDIMSTLQPIIIRRLEVVAFWSYRIFTKVWHQVPRLKWAFLENAKIVNTTIKCDDSKFWREDDNAIYYYTHLNNHDICIRLNFHNFVLSTKPWTSQLHLGIYPPKVRYSHRPINYPKVFTYSSGRHVMSHNIIPSPFPQIHINLFHELNQIFLQTVMHGWIQTITRNKYWTYQLSNDVFILITGQVNNTTDTSHLKMFYIQVCSVCQFDNQIELVELNDSSSIFSLLIHGNFATQKLWRWSIYREGRNEFFDNVAGELLKCENLKIVSHTQIFSHKTRTQQVEYAYATVWTSIMGNYTYFGEGNKQCLNGFFLNDQTISGSNFIVTFRGTRHLQYTTGGYLYPVDLPNLVDRLKFVSCGERGFTTFAFGELLRAFDHYVWTVLIISVIAFACSIHGMVGGTVALFPSILLTLSKILAEQGNPFSGRFLKNKKLRVILGIYLLFCVVISSAYKNRNIYKMIKSREILEYEKFSELVDANFSIYVRATMIDISISWRPTKEQYKFHVDQHSIYMQPTGVFSTVQIYSEISSLSYVVQARHSSNFNISSKSSQHEGVTLSDLQQATSLHPLMPSAVVTDVARNISMQHATNYTYMFHDEMKFNFRKLLEKAEMRLLNNSLRECNRTAVILPENICLRLANELRSEGFLHVFVGQEIYSSSIAIAFVLNGFVPRYILKRIQVLQPSGIWERWANFAKSESLGSVESIPQGASLQGNIFIVFTFFLGGNIVAVVTFWSEMLYVTLVNLENRPVNFMVYN